MGLVEPAAGAGGGGGLVEDAEVVAAPRSWRDESASMSDLSRSALPTAPPDTGAPDVGLVRPATSRRGTMRRTGACPARRPGTRLRTQPPRDSPGIGRPRRPVPAARRRRRSPRPRCHPDVSCGPRTPVQSPPHDAPTRAKSANCEHAADGDDTARRLVNRRTAAYRDQDERGPVGHHRRTRSRAGLVPRTIQKYRADGVLIPDVESPGGHARWSVEKVRARLAELAKERRER